MRLVKVLWGHRGVEEENWEREDKMRATYHFLFEDKVRGLIFGIRILLHIHVFVCDCMCEFWGRNSVKEITI